VGALRDRFHVAHLAGFVYSALVAGRNTLSRHHPRLMAGDPLPKSHISKTVSELLKIRVAKKAC
jgi:hypothetical protein